MLELKASKEDVVWLAGILQRIPAFAKLTTAQMDAIFPRFTAREYEKGETLIQEGEKATALFVIRLGTVRVSKKQFLVMSRPVAVLGPGDFVGEMSLLVNDARRAATVTALVPCRALMLPGDAFGEILAENFAVQDYMLGLARRRKKD